MPHPKGYQSARNLRHRSKDKRAAPFTPGDDGLLRTDGTLASCLDEYLDWLSVRHYSDMTVQERRKDGVGFIRWAQERDLLYPQQITRSILESYQRHLFRYRKKNDRPLGSSTQRKILTTLRLLFSWLCREHLIEANPAADLIFPRKEYRLPDDTLSIREMECILSVPDISDPLGIRDRAIMELLYSCGLRRRELVCLQVGDLNRERETLFIRQGKGHKDRLVPVGERALQWLEKYLEQSRPLLRVDPGEQTLFISGYGEGFNPSALGNLVRRYIRKADIGRERGGTHLFRHTCATHMLEGGADVRYIQEMLGHAKLDTTAVYTRVSIRQLKAVHAESHPAGRRDKSN
jgi:integrase/recombinase XerD